MAAMRTTLVGALAAIWLAASALPAGAEEVHTYVMHRPAPKPAATPTPTAAPPAATSLKYSQPYYGNEAYMQAYRRVIRSYNRSLGADELETIVRSILYYSHLFKIDPRFVVAVVACESAFRPHAVSSAGAGGLGQLMPDTARELHVDPHVPYQNIQGTVRYLKLNLDRFTGRPKRERMRLALASYNAGYGAVTSYGGVPPYAETQNYVNVVMAEWTKLSGER